MAEQPRKRQWFHEGAGAQPSQPPVPGSESVPSEPTIRTPVSEPTIVDSEATVRRDPAGGADKTFTLPAPGEKKRARFDFSSAPSSPGKPRTLGPQRPTREAEDLSNEKLLLSAPRSEYNAKNVPTLGGIPLLAKLGQGGMGAVYYGFHPLLNQEVAVKVLPFNLAENDPDMVARFFREAQIAAKIKSPNLVSVTDAREDGGLCFLVMEYVSGMTAGDYLKKSKNQMPEAEVLEIAVAAARGLDAAHKEGIIHRDIKPDNVLVPRDPATGELALAQAKLADLGLARLEEHGQSLTGSQMAMGTPGYMAPEQAIDARKCGKPADIFSMGATIYALLTGRAPFHGKASMEIMMQTISDPHEPVANLRQDVSPALAALVERCLQKEPQFRFKDAESLLKALNRVRSALGQGGDAQARLVEELRANSPEPAKAEVGFFNEMTIEAQAKPRDPRAEAASAEARLAKATAAGNKMKFVAGLILAGFFGAGFAMLFMGGSNSEKTVTAPPTPTNAPPPPARPPIPSPKIELSTPQTMPPGPDGKVPFADQNIKDNRDNMSKAFNRLSDEIDKGKPALEVTPVASVNFEEEAAHSIFGSFSTERIFISFILSVIGGAFVMYARKAHAMVTGLSGVGLLMLGWIMPSVGVAVMLAGILIALPIFLSNR